MELKVTKNELLKQWQEEAWKSIPGGLSMAKHEVLLASLCKVIADELAKGGEVPLPHIGKLKVREVAARTGRNPKTGEALDIPAKRKAVLVPGVTMKDALAA